MVQNVTLGGLSWLVWFSVLEQCSRNITSGEILDILLDQHYQKDLVLVLNDPLPRTKQGSGIVYKSFQH